MQLRIYSQLCLLIFVISFALPINAANEMKPPSIQEYQSFMVSAEPDESHPERLKGTHQLIFTMLVPDAKTNNEVEVITQLQSDGWKNIEILKWFAITKEFLAENPAKRQELEQTIKGKSVLLDYQPK